MPARRLALALTSCMVLTAACGDASGPGPDTLQPTPIVGSWTVSRSVQSQPPGCRELHANNLIATFQLEGEPAIAIAGGRLMEWSQSISPTTAGFVTEDYAFPSESTRPVLISHSLTWVNSLLIGSGQARGDGDDLGCTWSLTLTGIFVP